MKSSDVLREAAMVVDVGQSMQLYACGVIKRVCTMNDAYMCDAMNYFRLLKPEGALVEDTWFGKLANWKMVSGTLI